MNGADLGQSATWSCLDIFIFSTPPCVFMWVRRHLWDISRVSILINCARHRNIAVALEIFKQQLPTCSSASLQQLFWSSQM